MLQSTTLRLSVAFSLALASSAGAPRAEQGGLASITSLRCTYTTFAEGVWTDGTPTVTVKPEMFAFVIGAIDLKKTSARIIGNVGSAEATALLTPTGVNVIERTPLGNFNLTTVFITGAQGGKYMSVHSRHIGALTGPPDVTQNYGTCEAASPAP